MNRVCPQCQKLAIPVRELMFDQTLCPHCCATIAVQRVYSIISGIVVFFVTATTTMLVHQQLGPYYALLWFTLPIGSLTYLKARFSPLVVGKI